MRLYRKLSLFPSQYPDASVPFHTQHIINLSLPIVRGRGRFKNREDLFSSEYGDVHNARIFCTVHIYEK